MSGGASRREFIGQGLLAAVTLSMGRTGLAMAPDARAGRAPLERHGPPRKVLILGAGLAGLVAAHELVRAGHDVTVLEARTRAGGRVHTLRDCFPDGLYAEAGAARIPDNHEWTLRYVREFGLTLEPFWPTRLARLSCVRGVRLPRPPGSDLDVTRLPVDLSDEERRIGLPGMWRKYVAPLAAQVGDVTDPRWPTDALKPYDQMNITTMLRSRGASEGAITLMQLGFTTPQTDDMSALWMLRESSFWATEKTRYRIRGGLDLLPRAFSDRLKERIRYGAPVVRIEHDTRGVNAITRQANSFQKFSADRLICTIPFSVLRDIDVVPGFSDGKTRAIRELAYDSASRVYLNMRSRFWEREGLNGFAETDFLDAVWHPTFDQPGPRGVLFSYLNGARSRAVMALGEDERVNQVLSYMEQIFPGAREHFEGGFSFDWDSDPWARGAFALYRPGQMTQLYPDVARAEARVHFAGEHASPWNGWIQGALQSGYRAAQEVNEAV